MEKQQQPVQPVQEVPASVKAGQVLAQRVFAKRGNHSEAHLSQLELAALLAFAYEKGMEGYRF